MYPRRLCSCDQVPSSGPMYVHAGLEGSVIALTNVLGELVEKYRYTAFGLLTVLDAEGEEKATPALSPWLYHGRLFEEASGLYWMRMRHYSPQLGRFLQPDPAGIAGGINLYVYSNNNPLRFFDPWGLWPAPDATIDEALKGFFGELDAMMEQLWRNKIDNALEDFFKDLDAASSKHQCGESRNTTYALKRMIDNLHRYYKNRSEDTYRAMLDEINEMMTGRNADARDWLIENIHRPELVVMSLAIVRAYNGALESTLSIITDAEYVTYNQNLDVWKDNAYMEAETNPELGFSVPESIYP